MPLHGGVLFEKAFDVIFDAIFRQLNRGTGRYGGTPKIKLYPTKSQTALYGASCRVQADWRFATNFW